MARMDDKLTLFGLKRVSDGVTTGSYSGCSDGFLPGSCSGFLGLTFRITFRFLPANA
jgi:hypothetical protein